MKKVLVTGGTGTIGSAFIREYFNEYQFYALGHSEKRLVEFQYHFPSVTTYLCSIEDQQSLYSVFDKVRPDIVVHAAALKHIDVANRQPLLATSVNVIGSYNVVGACRRYGVPIAVAISTDKASDPHSVYGYTKVLMEKCFLEASFCVCRFGNVAGSAGSVIPLWKEQAAKGLPISITDKRMKRFMFPIQEAVGVIKKAIELCEGNQDTFILSNTSGFILSRMMKVVSIERLAKCFSPNVTVTGIRPGERLDECLFNAEEAKRATVKDGFILIGQKEVGEMTGAYTTETAEEMTDAELNELVRVSI